MSDTVERGHTVTTNGPVTGMVLGDIVDGLATVFDHETGLTHRIGVESLTVERPSR